MPEVICLPGLLATPDVFDGALAVAGIGGAGMALPASGAFTDIVDALASDMPRGAVLVGHSMGSYVALALALQMAEPPAGLVLVSTTARADTEKGAALRGKVVAWARDHGIDALAGSIADTMPAAGNRNDAGLRARVLEMARAVGVEVFAAHQTALAGRPDQSAALGGLACPVLVATGAEDRVTPPEAGRALADAVADGRFEEVPGAGHLLPLEAPEALGRLIGAFVAQLRAGARVGS